MSDRELIRDLAEALEKARWHIVYPPYQYAFAMEKIHGDLKQIDSALAKAKAALDAGKDTQK